MNANEPLTPDAQLKLQERSRKRKAILAGGVVLGLGAAITLAAWSDDVFAEGVFSTGTFELQGSTDGTSFADYDGPVGDETGVASLNFTMYPEEISPGDVNYAPFWLGVNGSQDALITIPVVTGTNEGLDPELSYTIYTGAISCDEIGVEAAGVTTAYSGDIGEAPTVSNPVTAPQLSATTNGIELCIAVSATSVQDDLPQGESTTITWQFTGTSVENT